MPTVKVKVIQYWARFSCGRVCTLAGSRRYPSHAWLVRRTGSDGQGVPTFEGFSGSEDLARRAARSAATELPRRRDHDGAPCIFHSSEVQPIHAT